MCRRRGGVGATTTASPAKIINSFSYPSSPGYCLVSSINHVSCHPLAREEIINLTPSILLLIVRWRQSRGEKMAIGRKESSRRYREKHKGKLIEYRRSHREQTRIYRKKYSQRLRLEALNHYSNGDMRCRCCGEKRVEFLCLDHINNDGAIHRRESYHNATHLISKRNGKWRDGIQVLCYNCNIAKKIYKTCPHQN
jgi:hypothetical protein